MKIKTLSVYIHIPFCVKKCLYCDFLSAPATGEQIESYVKALICEIKNESIKFCDSQVETVFFGGGTPSLLTPYQMSEIMSALKENYSISPLAEISMECNPKTATFSTLLEYRKTGINRLSIGLQSASNEELKALGRIHSYEDFLDTYHAARKAGFENINIDLMSALPGQSMESYEMTLKRVMELRPKHISSYSLIIEAGTAFEQWYDSEGNTKDTAHLPLPDEETERNMYYETDRILKENGYIRYEISNYAQKGYECRHNLVYWTLSDYVGFGIGAASYVDKKRYKNTESINRYITLAKEGKSCVEEDSIQSLSKKEQMEEFMFVGLRLTGGISRKKFEDEFGVTMDAVYGKELKKLQKEELLRFQGDIVALTRRGIDISNYVLAQFLMD